MNLPEVTWTGFPASVVDESMEVANSPRGKGFVENSLLKWKIPKVNLEELLKKYFPDFYFS